MNQIILIVFLLSSLPFYSYGQSEATGSPEKGKNKSGLHFEIILNTYINSEQLTITSQKQLDKILRILPQFPDLEIIIESHTGLYNFKNETPESEDESLARSEEIANTIKDYLVNKGVNSDLIKASGEGAKDPIVILNKKGKPYDVTNTRYMHMKNERIVLKLIPKFKDDIQEISSELKSFRVAYQVQEKK